MGAWGIFIIVGVILLWSTFARKLLHRYVENCSFPPIHRCNYRGRVDQNQEKTDQTAGWGKQWKRPDDEPETATIIHQDPPDQETSIALTVVSAGSTNQTAIVVKNDHLKYSFRQKIFGFWMNQSFG